MDRLVDECDVLLADVCAHDIDARDEVDVKADADILLLYPNILQR
jgi:hypothetical protein